MAVAGEGRPQRGKLASQGLIVSFSTVVVELLAGRPEPRRIRPSVLGKA